MGAIYRTSDGGGSWQAEVSDAAGAVRDLRRAADGRYVSVSSLGNFFATWDPGQATWVPHQRISSQRLQTMGFQPDGNLWMVTRGAQLRFNADAADVEAWSKPVIPITNGYGYLDMAWDPNGAIWAGGGSGTLLVSDDGGSSWKRDPLGGRPAHQLHPDRLQRRRQGLRAGGAGQPAALGGLTASLCNQPGGAPAPPRHQGLGSTS